ERYFSIDHDLRFCVVPRDGVSDNHEVWANGKMFGAKTRQNFNADIRQVGAHRRGNNLVPPPHHEAPLLQPSRPPTPHPPPTLRPAMPCRLRKWRSYEYGCQGADVRSWEENFHDQVMNVRPEVADLFIFPRRMNPVGKQNNVTKLFQIPPDRSARETQMAHGSS